MQYASGDRQQHAVKTDVIKSFFKTSVYIYTYKILRYDAHKQGDYSGLKESKRTIEALNITTVTSLF